LINKRTYRDYFIRVRGYVNFPLMYKSVGIKQSNFSSFIHGADCAISDDKILDLKSKCDEILVGIQEAELVFRSEK